jgi:hypothetical protein
MVQHEVHLLAAVAEVLGMVRVEGGALKTAHVIARFKVEAVKPFYTTGTGLKHDYAGSEGSKFIFR